MSLHYIETPCLACNREPGVPMCPLCAAIVDAERDAGKIAAAANAPGSNVHPISGGDGRLEAKRQVP